jgi:uncharacterized protein (DUF885 family)
MRFGWFGAYGEGWAHYTETLGTEFGLYTDPYQKMGYLSDQMLRAVRLVVDTGIHTGKMTREEAIKYYLNNISDSEEAQLPQLSVIWQFRTSVRLQNQFRLNFRIKS